MPFRIAVIGVGKIARDQHLPALAVSEDFELAAVVTRHEQPADVPVFTSLDELIASGCDVDAVSFCTPPQGRHALARRAIEAGYHVMLEKPPGATVSEIYDLIEAAERRGVCLFATWHSREAPAVEPARAWLAEREIHSVEVEWKEDVRKWHPGQLWIWEPGGLGVFDPGINALSVITRILPRPLILRSAELSFPANRAAPIAARLALSDTAGVPVETAFDWRQTDGDIWQIRVATDAGRLEMSGGGLRLDIGGETVVRMPDAEYPGLYRRFAELLHEGRGDVDLAPFRLVADAFMLGRRRDVEPFVE